MDWLISFVTAQVPLGAVAVAGVLGIVSGRLFRRAVLVEERQRADRAERAAQFATGRVAVQQPAAEALTRALAAPTEVAGSDLPPRAVLDATAVAADHLPPAMAETAAQDAQAVLDQTVPSLDLDGAYDVYGTDDDPEEPGDGGGPPGEVPVPAVTFAAILPRYDWSHARPWPAAKGVTPDRWSMYRWQAGRWVTRARTAWSQLRAYLAERWEAAGWERSDESPWSNADFRNFPPAHGGMHRADVFAKRADETGWQPRHGFEGVPPSIAVPLALMSPVERARELVRQLGQPGWLPPADRRLRGRRAHTFRVPSLPFLGCAP